MRNFVLMKQLSPSAKGLLVSVAAALAAFAAYFFYLKKENTYLADNASAKTCTFSLNEQAPIILAGGQNIAVNLKKGKNHIQIWDEAKNVRKDTIFEVKKPRGLLNIGQEDYVINTQYYGYNINKDSLLVASPKTKIDGKLYVGAPEVFRGIYTENFYYNVDEDYDRIVKKIQTRESRSKVFRKADFLAFYQKYYQF